MVCRVLCRYLFEYVELLVWLLVIMVRKNLTVVIIICKHTLRHLLGVKCILLVTIDIMCDDMQCDIVNLVIILIYNIAC